VSRAPNLTQWFGVSLAQRIPVGMMAIVYDLQPEQLDMTTPALRRRLGKETADYLTKFQARLAQERQRMASAPEFQIDITYTLAFTKHPHAADLVIASSSEGSPARIVEVPKDPATTHPFREKELVAHLNQVILCHVIPL